MTDVPIDLGREPDQHPVHPPAHVAVERVVGGEDPDAVPLDQPAQLEGGLAHLHPERFHLLRAGDGAAIVVGEHQDRHAQELGVEGALAGDVEVVAVDQGERARLGHGPGQASLRTTPTTTPQTSVPSSSSISTGG